MGKLTGKVRFFRRYDIERNSTVLVAKRVDTRERYAVGVSIPREYLDDVLAARGRAVVRRLQNALKRQMLAELNDDRQKHAHYCRPGDAVTLYPFARIRIFGMGHLSDVRRHRNALARSAR